jgi:hypothetical protein
VFDAGLWPELGLLLLPLLVIVLIAAGLHRMLEAR